MGTDTYNTFGSIHDLHVYLGDYIIHRIVRDVRFYPYIVQNHDGIYQETNYLSPTVEFDAISDQAIYELSYIDFLMTIDDSGEIHILNCNSSAWDLEQRTPEQLCELLNNGISPPDAFKILAL